MNLPIMAGFEANVDNSDKASSTPQTRLGHFGIELHRACVANSKYNVCSMVKELASDSNVVLISWKWVIIVTM